MNPFRLDRLSFTANRWPRPPVIYPYVCAVYPVVHVLAANPGNSVTIGRVLALCAGLSALTWVVLAVLYRLGIARERAAVVWSGAILLFFSYSPLLWVWTKLHSGLDPVRFRYPFMTATAAFLLLTLVALRGRRIGDASVVRLMNRGSLAMLVVPLGMIAFGLRHVAPVVDAKSVLVDAANVADGASRPRAVFFILLDSYAGDDTLREALGYDNSSFTSDLRSLGFSVPTHSASNYSTTFLSLSSTLNMSYLEELGGLRETDIEPRAREIFQRQEAVRLLKTQGYRFVWIGSGYDLDTINPLADETIDCSYFGEFEETLLYNSFLSIVMKWKGLGIAKTSRVPCMWEALREVTPTGRPVFVAAHVPAPHDPWVLGQTPEWRAKIGTSHAGDDWLDRQEYLAEITYLNQEAIATVQAILKSWGPNVVIMLEGDHGIPWPFSATSPLPQFVRERMRILNALYLPPGDRRDLPEMTTPVNTFRLVFERCFGIRIPRLPDRVFFSVGKDALHFQEVRLDSLW